MLLLNYFNCIRFYVAFSYQQGYLLLKQTGEFQRERSSEDKLLGAYRPEEILDWDQHQILLG